MNRQPTSSLGNPASPALSAPMSRQALVETLIRFIHHKLRIFSSPRGHHYKTNMAYLKHIEKANNLLLWAQNDAQRINPVFVYRFILQNKNHLSGIMPHPNNNSYHSQLIILNEIIQTCEHGLRQ